MKLFTTVALVLSFTTGTNVIAKHSADGTGGPHSDAELSNFFGGRAHGRTRDLRHHHSRRFRRSQRDEPKKVGFKPRLMGGINAMRAEICASMKREHGLDFGSFDGCVKFMKDACDPGKDKEMDGDKGEKTTGEGHCKEFFPKEKEEEEDSDDEDTDAAVSPAGATPGAPIIAESPAASTAPVAPAPATKPAKIVRAAPAPVAAKEKSGEQTGDEAAKAVSSPAAAMAAAPSVAASAPVSAPAKSKEASAASAADTQQSTVPQVPPALDDFKWAHKMEESKPMHSQGFEGRLVAHDDMKTMTSDWRQERLPAAQLCSICAKHPENVWCKGKCAEHSDFLHDVKEAVLHAGGWRSVLFGAVPLLMAMLV